MLGLTLEDPVPLPFVPLRCWLRVPADLRRAVWEAFRGPGLFSAEYLRARGAAVAAMGGT